MYTITTCIALIDFCWPTSMQVTDYRDESSYLNPSRSGTHLLFRDGGSFSSSRLKAVLLLYRADRCMSKMASFYTQATIRKQMQLAVAEESHAFILGLTWNFST